MKRKDFIKQSGALVVVSPFNILGSSFKKSNDKSRGNLNEKKICTACGTQFLLNSSTLKLCPICTDDRQSVPERGQTWTTLNYLQENHSVIIKK